MTRRLAAVLVACVLSSWSSCGGGGSHGDTTTSCAVAAQRCSGSDVQRCRADGSGWDVIQSCTGGQTCSAGACTSAGASCGDGACDPGEDCATCAADCGCKAGKACVAGACQTAVCGGWFGDLSVAASVVSLATGDLNGDALPDAVATLGDGSVVVLNNFAGGLQPFTVATAGAKPNRLVSLADLHGDGKLDLLVSGYYANQSNGSGLRIFKGRGDGTFDAPVEYADADTGYAGPAAVDLNGDGKLDVVTTHYGAVSVFLNAGDGTLGAPTRIPATGQDMNVGWPGALFAGDVNRDGKADVVLLNADTGQLALHAGKGDGTFQPMVSTTLTVIVSSNGRQVMRDLNGDGKLDLAFAATATSNGSRGVAVTLGNGDGTFAAAVLYPAGTDPRDAAVADLDGDGKLDLVVAADGAAVVLRGNGNGTFATATATAIAAGSTSVVALADLDGGGDPDALVGGWSAGRLTVLHGLSGATLKWCGGCSCTGKSCGDDGCGNSCGTCGGATTCTAGQCVTAGCTPSCAGKACGDNGCGGTCGTCASTQTCVSGQCGARAGGPGSVCTRDADCQVGRCLGTAVAGAKRYCSPPCSVSSDCADFWYAAGGFNISLPSNLQGTSNQWNSASLRRGAVCDRVGPYTNVGTDDGSKYCWFLCPSASAAVYDGASAITGCACLPNFTDVNATAVQDCQWDGAVECSVFNGCPTNTSTDACAQNVSCVVGPSLEGTCFSFTANIEACVAARQATCDSTCLANNCTGTTIQPDGSDPCVDMCCH